MFGELSSGRTDAPVLTEHSYLLLDGFGVDVPVTAYTYDDHPIIEPLYRGTRHAPLIEASPWLVRPDRNGQLLARPEVWAKHGLVMHCDSGFDTLSRHLRSLLSVTMPSGQMAYCRFYDPNWAARLFETMSQDEFEAWSGPIACWQVQGADGWTEYTNSRAWVAGSPQEEGWYRLRKEQLEQWQREEYDRFIAKTAQHLGYSSDRQDHAEQYERIEVLLEQARRFGFESEQVTMNYVELAWRFPLESTRPNWADRFADKNVSVEQRLYEAEKQLFKLDDGASA